MSRRILDRYKVGFSNYINYPWRQSSVPCPHPHEGTAGRFSPGYRSSVYTAAVWPAKNNLDFPGLNLVSSSSQSEHQDFVVRLMRAVSPAPNNFEELLHELHLTLVDPNAHRKIAPLQIDAFLGLLVANHPPPVGDAFSRDVLVDVVQKIRARLNTQGEFWNFALNTIDHWCYHFLVAVRRDFSLKEYNDTVAFLEPITTQLLTSAEGVNTRLAQAEYAHFLKTLVAGDAGPTLVTTALINAPTLPISLAPYSARVLPDHIISALAKRPDQQVLLARWQSELAQSVLRLSPHQPVDNIHPPLAALSALDHSGFTLPPGVIKQLVAWCRTRSDRRHYEALAKLPSFVSTKEGSAFLTASLDKDTLLAILRYSPVAGPRLKALGSLLKYWSRLEPETILSALADNIVPPTKPELALLLTHPARDFRLVAATKLAELAPSPKSITI